jgi:hypothetical protein
MQRLTQHIRGVRIVESTRTLVWVLVDLFHEPRRQETGTNTVAPWSVGTWRRAFNGIWSRRQTNWA